MFVEERGSADVVDLLGVRCEEREARCLHCGGGHCAGSAQCPRTVREVEICKVRGEGEVVAYAEAARVVEERGGRMEVESQVEVGVRRESVGVRNCVCGDGAKFLAFVAMVINCSMEARGKSDRVEVVLEAARRFLGIDDVTGKGLDSMLRESCTSAGVGGAGRM